MKNAVLRNNPIRVGWSQSVYWCTRILATTAIFLVAGIWMLAQAQSKTITGKVLDDTGSELPGVSVLVKGTTQGTITDIDGNYSLSVEGSPTLIFSFVGFVSQEVPVGSQSVINVNLEQDTETLEEVVVVGYGAQKKSDVTGAISSVNAAAISEVPAPDAALAIQGRVAGVDLQRTGSKPGSGVQIRIRGNRSLDGGANNPLIVLDGIPYLGDLNSIPQGTIQSIDILKDASATAIYGSRGSNGVIIITTKRGKSGEFRVSYNGYYGISTALDKYDVFNGEEYANLVQDSQFEPLSADETESILLGREVNWQDLMFKDGYITNHELTFTGGSEKTQYLAAANFFEETNALPGQAFSRYSLRLSLDHEANDRIRMGVSQMTTYAETEGQGRNQFFSLLTLSPLVKPYTDEGEINRLPLTGKIDEPFGINPLLDYNTDLWEDVNKRLQSFTSLYGEVDLYDGLKYRINVGLDATFNKRGTFSSALLGSSGANSAGITNSFGANYTIENLLLYDKSFGQHNVKFTGLFSVQENQWHQQSFNTTGIANDQLQYYNFQQANETVAGGQNYDQWGILSYMARVNYGFADKYLVTLTGRIDGSSRLAEGKEYFAYPAAAFGWNIYNEPFMQGVDFISNLKLRLGWGRTSNQAIGAFESLGRLSPRAYSFGPDGGENGYYVTNLPNENLSWEFTSNTNIGVDFGLFTNRVTSSIEVYQQDTEDILQSVALPIMSGVSGSFRQNLGTTRNRGLEVTLSGLIVESAQNDGFNWEVDLNFTTWNEEITSLVDTLSRNIGSGWFVGHPVDVIYDYKKIGIWQSDEADEAADFDGRVPGDIKVADLNGNGIRDDEDRTIIGKLNPDWIGGITSRFSYKGFDLSVVAFARVGGMIVSRLHQVNPSYPIATMEGRRNQVDQEYWTPENGSNNYPRTGIQTPAYGSTLGYFNGTFMKIRSINLGYNLPTSLLNNVGINSARVYFTANNPFKAFFSDLVQAGAIDPEPNNRGDTTTPGFGNRLNMSPDSPIMKSFILGVNLEF